MKVICHNKDCVHHNKNYNYCTLESIYIDQKSKCMNFINTSSTIVLDKSNKENKK